MVGVGEIGIIGDLFENLFLWFGERGRRSLWSETAADGFGGPSRTRLGLHEGIYFAPCIHWRFRLEYIRPVAPGAFGLTLPGVRGSMSSDTELRAAGRQDC